MTYHLRPSTQYNGILYGSDLIAIGAHTDVLVLRRAPSPSRTDAPLNQPHLSHFLNGGKSSHRCQVTVTPRPAPLPLSPSLLPRSERLAGPWLLGWAGSGSLAATPARAPALCTGTQLGCAWRARRRVPRVCQVHALHAGQRRSRPPPRTGSASVSKLRPTQTRGVRRGRSPAYPARGAPRSPVYIWDTTCQRAWPPCRTPPLAG
ncbi:uncharacterized protein C8Q71DRAFT_345851 [Rhodofomes roseus]|uniref:Uncharacterized protein n=1 Tax=Rhodofomes roseus TaxID=34475 RepID=A0ABQ8KSE2_9APHY|nr:uncharacterized protein C8Q71DRAFT_345851 [Rhodofomes roseus]KAH9841728.1 hypothetical protein C8Q71DRAFT_345851 [Rhodofomes roseus]